MDVMEEEELLKLMDEEAEAFEFGGEEELKRVQAEHKARHGECASCK